MLKKSPALASQGISPPHTPLLDPVLADSETSACRQPAFQLASKRQTKDFTTPPPRFRLQSSSRAPCLNKRCSIFLGNDEATSHKRKEKIPQVQKASWKTNRTASLARAERKGFDIQAPRPWQRSLLCGNRGDKPHGEGGGKSLWPDVENSSFQSWRPNLTPHFTLSKVPLGAPQSSLPLTHLKQQT